MVFSDQSLIRLISSVTELPESLGGGDGECASKASLSWLG